MKTALLLTSSAEVQHLLADVLGPGANLIFLPPPEEPTREQYDALYAKWLDLADVLIVDAASLEPVARWAIESLSTAPLQDHHTVVVRMTVNQRTVYELSPDWLVVADTDGPDQWRQSLGTALRLREAQSRVRQAGGLTPGPVAASARPDPVADLRAPAGSSYDSYRYREALKSISGLLSQQRDETVLLAEFMRLLRELLSLSKVAIFTPRPRADLFARQGGLATEPLSIAVSTGMRPELVSHFRLTFDGGIGGYLAREGKILRRNQTGEVVGRGWDQQAAREFGVLGAEVAVPMTDNDQLVGVITFSGKITGESLTIEELELAYHLASQLARTVRNLRLLDQVAGQQRFMSEVLAHVQSGVIVIGREQRVLSVNRYARELLGLGNRDVTGESLRSLPSRVADVLFETLQTGQEIYKREVTLPPGNRPLGVSTSQFALGSGSRPGPGPAVDEAANRVVIGLVEDLTQVKREQARTRAEADREFFTRLAARMSHELKNSLVAIRIYSQLLPERYHEKEFREQFSGVVGNEVNRVDVLVNNLTFFAHPLDLVYESLVLSELMDGCVQNISQEFARKKAANVVEAGDKSAKAELDLPTITVKKMYGHKTAQLDGDKIRLMQAFEHVLRNAVQALPAGGRLSVSTAEADPTDFPGGQLPAGGALRIEFQDAGEGIALENLKRVTEPFVTTRNVGVGLGLTIVKKIVDRHGGRLDIDSVLGRGTTVKIILPVKMQPPTEDALQAPITKTEDRPVREGASDEVRHREEAVQPLGGRRNPSAP